MTFRGSALIITLIFGLISIAWGQSSSAQIELSWTAGACRGCRIVRQIGDLVYVTATTIWAEGYSFPREGQGAGDYSIVWSNDHGRHWVEVAKTRMHAGNPSVSFLNERT